MSTEWMLIYGMKEFQCKPKPGCHIARCDPVPMVFPSHLDRNEYPITCAQSNSEGEEDTVTRGEYNKLLQTLTALQQGGEYAVTRDEYNLLLESLTNTRKKLATLEKRLKAIDSKVKILLSNNVTRLINTAGITTSSPTEEATTAGPNKQNQICEEKNSLIYNGKCYFIPYLSNVFEINYTQAVEFCSSRNSLLAEMPSLDHQFAVENFIRPKIPSSRIHVSLWTGMNYQSSEKNFLLRSGKEVSENHLKQYRGRSVRAGKIVILVRKDDRVAFEGLAVFHPSGQSNGAICEVTL